VAAVCSKLCHLKEKDVTQFTVNGERRERDKVVKGITKRKQRVMDEDAK
jgi:hypothetical protein